MIHLKSPEEVDRIRMAAGVVAEALDMIEEMMIPGVTTEAIDTRIERFIRDAGGVPAFLGYQGYPASSCISLNDGLGPDVRDRLDHERDPEASRRDP
jgi:methionyl aminopeptidase